MAGDVKSRACVKLELSMFVSPGLVGEQISDSGDFFQSFLIASGAGVGGGDAHQRDHGVVTRPAGDISAAPIDAELPRLAGRVEAAEIMRRPMALAALAQADAAEAGGAGVGPLQQHLMQLPAMQVLKT